MKAGYRMALSALLCLPIHAVWGQHIRPDQATLEMLAHTRTSSFRGLSVVDDSVLWVSGSQGTVGCSRDGGKTWKWMQIKGAEHLDFRSIKAFNSQKALIVSAGTPARIYRTTDHGLHWTKTYENEDDRFFLDGLIFWDENRGLVYGDPIDGHFVLLYTEDGGRHWQVLPAAHSPSAQPGEVSFAASGTAIFALPPARVWIGTGGRTARVHYADDYGKSWRVASPAFLQGKPSQGIFSLAFFNPDQGIAVGGDYQADSIRANTAFLTFDGGKTWQRPDTFPRGYRSSVVYLNAQQLIATGKSGTDFSLDGGKTWHALSDTGFYVVQRAGSGEAVFLAGSEGRIARLKGYPQDSQSGEAPARRQRD